jgi:GT2 family glycosyltransferase
MITELSIIIPTLNEEKYLPKLLNSIVDQRFLGNYEVIVVDGNSADSTKSLARNFSDQLPISVHDSVRGVSTQRNAGARLARYETLLFIDADVVLSRGLLNGLCTKARSDRPFFCQVRHTSTDKMNAADFFFLMLVHVLLLVAWLGRSPALNGDFVLTNKATFALTDGFTEGAILGEDTEYGLNAFRHGARYRFYPFLVIAVSPRRVRTMGRLKLLMIWSKAFLHVRRHGAIKPNQGYDYIFGQH